MERPKLYTPAEVADMLRVTPAAIHQWVKQGKIKAVRIGRIVRIPESEIALLLGRDVGELSPENKMSARPVV